MELEAIKIKDLTTGYNDSHGRKEVTRSLSATLQVGEMVALLGPNGAGKSTMMRTLAGFQHPLSGSVEVMGRSIVGYSPRELSRMVSVVLTEKPMLEDMDVETLVALGRAPYTGFFGRLSAHDREVVDRSIALVGIDNLKGRMVPSLSDGERQKVMIAKALAQETAIILLDEPTAFLDFPSKVEIMQLLHRLAHEAQKLIFISTHDLEIALQVSDRVWLIDKKLGVTPGAHAELAASGALERYFGRPGISFDPATGFFKINDGTHSV